MPLSQVLPTLILAFLSNCCANKTCNGRTTLSEKRDPDHAIVDVVFSLQWPSVTLFLENTTDLQGITADQLHKSNISTMVLSADKIPTVTNSDSCSSVVWTRGCVVLGTYTFTEHVLKQVLEYTQACHLGSLLFTTEWLTVVTEVELQASLRLFRVFQNVAALVTSQTGCTSLWTLRHIKDVSDMIHVTSLPPAVPVSRHRILPNLCEGLGGRTLRVVTKEFTYIVTKHDSEQDGRYEGLAMDVLRELSLRVNFSYVFVPSPDGNWGQQLDNGQWNGPIGMLTRKEVDLAASSFAVSYSRTIVADVTTPIMYDTSTVIFKLDRTRRDHLTFFTQPFQSLVYGAIGGCFLIVLKLLVSLEMWQETLHVVPPRTKGRAYEKMSVNCEILLAGLLAKPHGREERSRAGRVLVVTWLMLGMVLASVYSSQLTSSMTVRQQTLPFRSLSQLLDQDTYTWGFLSGGSMESLLKFSTIPEFQQYHQTAIKFSESDPEVLSNDLSVHLAKVVQGNYAFFSTNNILYNVLAANHCDIKHLSDVKMTSAFAFYLQKGSPYTRLLSDEIGKMEDSGLIDFWRRKWSPRQRQCEPAEDEKSGKVIGLTETQTAFYLAALGLAMAGLALLVERLI